MAFTKYQQKAIEHNLGNAIVSASAGSGKTTVVIERIVRLIIEKGVSVNNILAVTFTTMAAAEMKEKLKDKIIEKINATETSSEEKVRLKTELEFVNGADISTIHSFCNNLIKKYFYAIDVDSTFEICDETKAQKLKLEAMDNAFEKLYEENSPQFLTALDVFSRGRTDRNLRDTVYSFASFIESEVDVNAVTNRTEFSTKNVTELLNVFLLKYYQARISFIYNKLLKIKPFFEGITHREEQIALFESKLIGALNANNYTELASIFTNAKIKRKNKQTEYDEILKSYHKEFEELAEEGLEIFYLSSNENVKLVDTVFKEYESLVYVYNKYNEEYVALKRDENLVDFSDLEHYAYKLLLNGEILNAVKNQYKYVFIDEYQDVNGVQEKIVELLSNANEFMVGDSKQSIYAFRGCNPKYFIEKNDAYVNGVDGNVAIPLDKNFRSSKSVVNMVNSVFSRIMTKSFGGHDYSKNQMQYGGLYTNENAGVEYEGKAVIDVIVNDVESDKAPILEGVYSVKKADALGMAKEDVGTEEKLVYRLICDALGKKYYDIKSKTEKEVTYGDIVILMRSVTGLGEKIINYLVKKGVPVSAETKEGIGDYPEIKTLVNFIKLISLAEQDVPLANTLLDFFNVSDEELAEIRSYGDKFIDRYATFYDVVKAYALLDNELAEKLKAFFIYLDKTRVLLEFATAGDVLTRVISETGYDAKIMASNFGDAKMRRIERFITAISNTTVNDFVLSIDDILAKITVNESAGENTVKVMTMHGSKGLEFPYVIIAGTDKAFNFSDAQGFFIKDRDLGVSLKSINREEKLIHENLHHAILNKKIKEQAVFEEVRLFYVALTRAKYELHVIVSEDKLKSNDIYIGNATCETQFLKESDAEICRHYESELIFDTPNYEKMVAGNEISSELSSLIKRNLTLSYAYQNDTVLPVKSSVSKINSATTDEYYKTVEVFGESDAEKGTLYHKALELVNFYADVDAELSRLTTLGAFTNDELNTLSAEKLKNILKLEVFNEIKTHKLYKELKFYNLVSPSEIGLVGNDAEILIQGIIDLVAIKDNKAVLIDYKLSKIASDGDLIAKYYKQLKLYALAIEKSLKIKVDKVYLVNILQEKCIEVKL